MTRRIATTLTALITALVLAAPAAHAASQPQVRDLTQLFRDGGVTVGGLRVLEVGGIVVIRGRAADHAQAEQAGAFAVANGFTRVANLVQLVEIVNEGAIERAAERQLAARSLDGCLFKVDSQNGVVHLAGSVKQEFQKDLAVQLLRSIDGVKAVTADLR